MTDSGGFQVFSLGASLVRLDEEGVRFRSIVDGSEHFFSPEAVITLQQKLGADIALVLDECTSPLHSYSYTKRAMERTHRWAKRGLEAFREGAKGEMSPNPGQVLYGIVQGGAYRALRQESAQRVEEIGFEGFAIGGSLGRSKEEMHLVLDWTIPYLGVEKPRHLLGIGEIDDIFAAVERGVDTFDCAASTRIARNGTVFVRDAPRHRINLRNARFKSDPNPIASHCDCFACRHHSRAYLRHLCRSGELSFYRLASMHNLRFIVRLMSDIRAAITAGRFNELEQEWQTARRYGSA
jgi:tRNA-guanine transglycosylase